MKQPYTYTLPEQFIKDESVPARWRVWAVINGFFVGGQYCWASNEFIGEQIGAHKDTVSQAVKELESLGIVRCERGARSRNIYPMIGANAYQWSVSTPISDRRQRLSISVSNSDKEVNLKKDFSFKDEFEIQEENPKPKKERKDKLAWSLQRKCYDLLENATGVRPIDSGKDYFRVLEARKYLSDSSIKDMVEDAINSGKAEKSGNSLGAILSNIEIQKYKLEYA